MASSTLVKKFIDKPFEQRKVEFQKEQKLYPNNVIAMVEVIDDHNRSKQKKLMVPKSITVTEFMMKLSMLKDISKKDQAASLVSLKHRKIVSNAITMEELYNQCKDEDGYLYLKLEPSNPF